MFPKVIARLDRAIQYSSGHAVQKRGRLSVEEFDVGRNGARR
jgi:hypothetical protein